MKENDVLKNIYFYRFFLNFKEYFCKLCLKENIPLVSYMGKYIIRKMKLILLWKIFTPYITLL